MPANESPQSKKKAGRSEPGSSSLPLELRSQLPVLEALLFAADVPLSPRRLCDLLTSVTEGQLKNMVETLNREYEQNGRAFRIQFVAGGYRLYTLPEFAPYVEKLYRSRQAARLSQKALETLAIIAYRQPVTRAEIEQIRGVNVDSVIKTLLNRKLITIAGTASTPGQPYLYKTTSTFLEYFGLKSLKDLPRLKEIDEILQADDELIGQIGEEVWKEISPEVLGLKTAVEGHEGEQNEPDSTESKNNSS